MARSDRIYEYGEEIWNETPSEVVLELQQKYVEALKPKHRLKIKELRDRVFDVLQPKHNDLFLVKWLRARNFDLNASENMLRSHLKWRQKVGADTIHDDLKIPEVVRAYTPIGIAGEDLEGCPVFILRTGNVDYRGILHSSTKAVNVNYFIHNMELTERLKLKLSEKHCKVISLGTTIIDLDNFSLRDFMWKPALELFIEMMQLFEAQYPESLKKAIVINAPKVFQVFYSLLKPFMGEVTKSKVEIYSKDGWKEALLEIIDPDQLPKHWGGNQVDEVDGNPYCLSRVVMGGKVPESYYKSLSSRMSVENEVKKVTVDKKSSYTVEVKVEKTNSTLTWAYQTEHHDIGFHISLKKNNTDIEVLPLERVPCQLVPADGTLNCTETGTYTLMFDNTYSWYRSKTLYYEVRVSD